MKQITTLISIKGYILNGRLLSYSKYDLNGRLIKIIIKTRNFEKNITIKIKSNA